jgi:hypothetical protein
MHPFTGHQIQNTIIGSHAYLYYIDLDLNEFSIEQKDVFYDEDEKLSLMNAKTILDGDLFDDETNEIKLTNTSENRWICRMCKGNGVFHYYLKKKGETIRINAFKAESIIIRQKLKPILIMKLVKEEMKFFEAHETLGLVLCQETSKMIVDEEEYPKYKKGQSGKLLTRVIAQQTIIENVVQKLIDRFYLKNDKKNVEEMVNRLFLIDCKQIEGYASDCKKRQQTI